MKKDLRIYTSAPLPFQGQKRRYVKEFSKVIKELQPAIVVDLFGGSGLLSHTTKRVCPFAKVVYNDYDNYSERLSNVDKTNALIADLRAVLKDYPKENQITGKTKESVLKRLKRENESSFVDWITVSSSLLFSMNYAMSFSEFEKENLYNNIKVSNYCIDGYLNGLEIVRMDYKTLFDLYKDVPGVLFIIDPPYLSTDVNSYNSGRYWRIGDYLDVLSVLKGVDYVFFTSNKSNVIELLDWCGKNSANLNLFSGAVRREINTNPSYNAKYVDIMMYKVHSKELQSA